MLAMECSYVVWTTHDRIRVTLNIMLRCDCIYETLAILESDEFPPPYVSELVGTQALLAFVDVAKLSTFSLIISSCLCQEISQLPIGCRNKGKGKGKCKGKGNGKEQGKTEERSKLDDVAKQQSQPWKSSRMKERLRESFMLRLVSEGGGLRKFLLNLRTLQAWWFWNMTLAKFGICIFLISVS